MILAFSGSRRGLTAYQRANLPRIFSALPDRFVHGGAPGADWEVDAFLAPLYWRSGTAYLVPPIEVFPTAATRGYWLDEAALASVRLVNDPDEPLVRNRLIVAAADRLLAAPATPTEVRRSGTWSTIRYARAAGKPVTILLPWAVPWSESGVVEEAVREQR